MKTFDEWWEAHPISKVEAAGAVIEGIRQTCREAWNASKESGEFRITGPGRYLLKIGDDELAEIIISRKAGDLLGNYEENGQNKHLKDHRLIARLPDVPSGGED
jgi:hypothetical protein